MIVNKEFINLEDAVNYIYENASNYAIEGVKENIGGPFGAGIIKKINVENDTKYIVLNISRNEVIINKNPIKHAEVVAIEEACKIKESCFLENCILVSTAKSCPMCLSASIWAKIPVIYYSEDFAQASKSGFKDDDISEYIKGNNKTLIKQINMSSSFCALPFEAWNNKEKKIQY